MFFIFLWKSSCQTAGCANWNLIHPMASIGTMWYDASVLLKLYTEHSLILPPWTVSNTTCLMIHRYRVPSIMNIFTLRMSHVFFRGALMTSSLIGVMVISSKWAVNSTSKLSLATISRFPGMLSHLMLFSWFMIHSLKRSLFPSLKIK